MLEQVRGEVSDRRFRLFACAACRAVWPFLADPRSRRAVEVAERYADGLATEEERRRIADHGRGMLGVPLAGNGEHVQDDRIFPVLAWLTVWDDPAGAAHVMATGRGVLRVVPPAAQAALLREVAGNPFRPATLPAGEDACPKCHGKGDRHRGRGRRKRCPYCHGAGRHLPWLTWDGGTVLKLARAAYLERGGEECGKCRGNRQLFRCRMCRGLWPTRQTEGLCVGCLHKGERVRLAPPTPCPDCAGEGRIVTTGHLDPDRLAVLADAAQEAGCEDAQLLGHLRSPGPHVRGCVAVDLILGKT